MTDDPEVRANEAQRLLDNPLLTEIMDALESEAVKQWKTTSVDQVAIREDLFQLVKANQRIRAALQSAVDNGAIVAARNAASQSNKLRAV